MAVKTRRIIKRIILVYKNVDVGLQYGGKVDAYQWAVSALYSRDLKATIDDGSAKTKVRTHKTFLFAGEFLAKITERSFLKGLTGINFADSYKDNSNGYAQSTTTFRLGAEYQHLCSANFMVKAGFENRTISLGSEDMNKPMYYVGANYQF